MSLSWFGRVKATVVISLLNVHTVLLGFETDSVDCERSLGAHLGDGSDCERVLGLEQGPQRMVVGHYVAAALVTHGFNHYL